MIADPSQWVHVPLEGDVSRARRHHRCNQALGAGGEAQPLPPLSPW